MKVIDLLNKISNEEDVPKQMKYESKIYTYNNEYQDYELFDKYGHSWLLNTLFDDYSRTKETLDCELEIIEESKKTVFRFDKDGISMYTVYNDEEIEEDKEIGYLLTSTENNKYLVEKINELIKAVNELKKGK